MKVKITDHGGGMKVPGVGLLEAGKARDIPDDIARGLIKQGLAKKASEPILEKEKKGGIE